MRSWSIKGRWISVALALIVFCVAVSSSSGAQETPVAGSEPAQDYDIMFTKWITCYSDPNTCTASDGTLVDYPMAGIITGGDAGTGSFSGELLNVIQTTPELWEGVTVYQIQGTTHEFSAHMLVMENPATGEATLAGIIMDGWLKGQTVHGSYNTTSSCPDNPNQPPDPLSPCYEITLHIHAGD
jgi:hypothetical protein